MSILPEVKYLTFNDYIPQLGINVILRKSDCKNVYLPKQEELARVLNYFTEENFIQDGKYYTLVNPDNFEVKNIKYSFENDGIIDDLIIKRIFYKLYNFSHEMLCICGEDTCKSLIVIRHRPTDLYFAIGSVCYKKFDPSKKDDIYYIFEAKPCKKCNKPLVQKQNKEQTKIKNTSKKCEGICYDCFYNEDYQGDRCVMCQKPLIYKDLNHHYKKNADDNIIGFCLECYPKRWNKKELFLKKKTKKNNKNL